jgi:hypothetical protein
MTEARKKALLGKDKSYRKHIRHYADFLQYKDEFFPGPVKNLKPEDMLNYVKRYFDDIKQVFQEAASSRPGNETFEIGAYGSGLVCEFLRSKNVVERCWLAQSTGWPGYADFKAKGKWSLLQENPTTCPGWKSVREPRRLVQFDFNKPGARPNFGQWSSTRANTKPIDRPRTCPAL